MVHVVNEHNRPICKYRPAASMSFQWCAAGVQWEYLKCDACKERIRRSMAQLRTLARVVAVHGDRVWVTFPAWDHRKSVSWPPETFRSFNVKPFIGMRFHIFVNIHATHCDDLQPDFKTLEESANQHVPTIAELTGQGDPAVEQADRIIGLFRTYLNDHGLDQDAARASTLRDVVELRLLNSRSKEVKA